MTCPASILEPLDAVDHSQVKFITGNDCRKHHCLDLLKAADSGHCSVLELLDLSEAFNTINHVALINRRKNWVGICGTALDWFSSYLSNRKVLCLR